MRARDDVQVPFARCQKFLTSLPTQAEVAAPLMEPYTQESGRRKTELVVVAVDATGRKRRRPRPGASSPNDSGVVHGGRSEGESNSEDTFTGTELGV
jgi:hypothetical protein